VGEDAFVIKIEVTQTQMQGAFALVAFLSLNPFVMFLLNKILGLVSELILVSHFVVLDLNYSPNLLVFFKSIFPLLIFDALPTDILY